MPYQYANLEELVKDLLPSSIDNAEETAAIGRVLEGVSNFIDKFCRRPEQYYSPLPKDLSGTARRFRGEGNGFLRLPPYVGDASIQDIDSSQFYAHPENGWLYFNQSPECSAPLGWATHFVDGYAYLVTAKWGFAETPAAIREAARQLTLRTWETQRGIFGQLTPTGTVIERAMPPIVEEILLTFRRRQFEIS